MPKMKTHSGAKKRFKVTGSGKVKRFSANCSHLMRKKSKRAKLVLRGSTLVSSVDAHQKSKNYSLKGKHCFNRRTRLSATSAPDMHQNTKNYATVS